MTQAAGQPARPLAPDVGVIGLVPNDWADLWQPRHQVMARLARYFHVVWVNPAREWRDVWRPAAASPAGPATGWEVYRPPWYLPLLHRPQWLAELVGLRRLDQAWKRIAIRGARSRVLYLWRPQFAGALRWPHELSLYHIDDEYSFDLVTGSVDPTEVALIRRADQVIIHSPGLLEEKGRINPQTVNIPNGVNYETFAEPRLEPDDIARIPHPRIGYAGWLKLQLDWALLDRVAAASPQWSFVFVGAIKHLELLEQQAPFRALRARPNVHFLGRKTPHELAAYPQHFDVCIMPYRVTPYTDRIYPLKLHEYLASGRPTVGTPIRALKDFAEVVTLAADPVEWTDAIEAALNGDAHDQSRRESRRRVARAHDWDLLVARIARLIAVRLGHPIAAEIDLSLRDLR